MPLARPFMLRRLLFATTALGLLFAAPTVHAQAIALKIAWLKVGGADQGSELTAWAQEIRLRTSIDIAPNPVGVRPEDPTIFQYPLLYWGGDRNPGKLTPEAVVHLRQHLSTGGTLIIDNTGKAEASQVFDAGVRRELQRIFPQPLQRVPPSHVVFRSFYRLDRPVGRRADSHDLEGLRVGAHFAVLYTRNDLAGAFARLPFGGFALTVVPGGENQREQAFRLGVNLVMYALCLDYKDDHTHVMQLLRYRRGTQVPSAHTAPEEEEP